MSSKKLSTIDKNDLEKSIINFHIVFILHASPKITYQRIELVDH